MIATRSEQAAGSESYRPNLWLPSTALHLAAFNREERFLWFGAGLKLVVFGVGDR